MDSTNIQVLKQTNNQHPQPDEAPLPNDRALQPPEPALIELAGKNDLDPGSGDDKPVPLKQAEVQVGNGTSSLSQIGAEAKQTLESQEASDMFPEQHASLASTELSTEGAVSAVQQAGDEAPRLAGMGKGLQEPHEKPSHAMQNGYREDTHLDSALQVT